MDSDDDIENDTDDSKQTIKNKSSEEDGDGSANIVCDKSSERKRANMEPAQIPGFMDTFRQNENGKTASVENFGPIDYYRLFMSDELIASITVETNCYAEKLASQSNLKPQSRLHACVPTTNEEMCKFPDLILLMALTRKLDLQMYWMTDLMLSTPFLHMLCQETVFCYLYVVYILLTVITSHVVRIQIITDSIKSGHCYNRCKQH